MAEESTRDGQGMPADRSGAVLSFKERWEKEKEEKKAAKEAKKHQTQTQQVLQGTVTREELAKTLMKMYAGMERLAGEIRTVGIRSEAVLTLLYAKEVISREEYMKYAEAQMEWNQFLAGVDHNLRTGEVPIPQLVKQIHEWNACHDLKVTWQHVDIAIALRDDSDLTLEEKLTIAAELDMPESYINELRLREQMKSGSAADIANSLTEGLNESLSAPAEATPSSE